MSKTATEETVEAAPGRAVLFDLENVAVQGHQLLYNTLGEVLAGKKVKLTQPLFSRFCLDATLYECVCGLLTFEDKKGVRRDKLVAQVGERLKARLTAGDLKLDPALAGLLKAASARGILSGALSCLDPETAEKLAGDLGLSEMGVSLLPAGCENNNGPGADGWLKLARKMSVQPALCGVIASSAWPCKTALAAGMRCVALLNKFSSFQDFGGADLVVEALDDVAEGLFELLEIT